MSKFLKKHFTAFGNVHYAYSKTADTYLLGDIKVSLNILTVAVIALAITNLF